MSQDNRFQAEPGKKSREEIENEIVQSRTALSQDLHALGEKLSPEHLKEGAKGVIDEVKHAAVDTIREARYAAADSIREAKEAASGSLREAKEVAAGSIRDAKDAAVGSLRDAKDTALYAVTETAHEIGVRAQRVGRVTSSFVSANALPLGLMGLGVGWLMLSINHSRNRRRNYENNDGLRSFGSGGTYDPRSYEDDDRWSAGRAQSYGSSSRMSATRSGAAGAVESVRGAAEAVSERAGDLTHRAAAGIDHARAAVSERAGDLTHRAAAGIDQARSAVDETLESARSRVGELRTRAVDMSQELRHRAVEASHDLRDRASDLSSQAYGQLQRAGTRTLDYGNENPLAVGALAVVAGLGVGLLLPSTERENALLGETRDRLLDDAQRAASRLGEGVQRTASDLKGAIQAQR